MSDGVDSHLDMTQSLCVTAQRKCFGRRTVVHLIHKNASDGHHVLVVVVVVIALLPPFICLERRTEKRTTAPRFLGRWGPRLTREDGEQSLPHGLQRVWRLREETGKVWKRRCAWVKPMRIEVFLWFKPILYTWKTFLSLYMISCVCTRVQSTRSFPLAHTPSL